MEVVSGSYMPGDPRLVEQIVYELKSRGIFDQFRKECISDVDTKPAYQNLRQRVEGNVESFLKLQKWRPDMNKNQVREMLRKNIYESGFLEKGVERIVEQVVNPKVSTVFLEKVEEVFFRYLGIEKPVENKTDPSSIDPYNLLPNDLEAVSPESNHDTSTERPELQSMMDVSQLSSVDSKMEEDESPPFEPLEVTTLPPGVTQDENSVDSHMSGFSGLASHDSNHSSDAKMLQIDLSTRDSYISQNSSEGRLSIITSDENSKTDIAPKASKATNSDKDRKISNEKVVKEESRKSETSFSKSKSSSSKSSDRDKDKDKYRSRDKDKKTNTSSSRDKDYKSKHSSSASKDKDKSKDKKDYKSSSSSSKDRSDKDKQRLEKDKDKNQKDKERSEKDKERSGKDKERSEKDKQRSEKDRERSGKDKERSEKDKERSGKDKERSEKDRQRSDKDKPRSDKDKLRSEKDKERSGRDKERSEKDKERSEKDKERSEKDKERSEKDKDRSDKDKSRSSLSTNKHSSNSHDKSSSSKSSSSKDKSKSSSSSKSKSTEIKSSSSSANKSSSSSANKSSSSANKLSSSSSSSNKPSKHSSSTSKNKEKDKKRDSRKDKDDHYSSKDKRSDRRSTDRDDGQSSKQSSFSSSDNTSSQSRKSRQENNENKSGKSAGDHGNSDNTENSTKAVNITESVSETEVVIPTVRETISLSELQTLKLYKPKFASNFKEAQRIMKIRKQLKKLEKHNRLILAANQAALMETKDKSEDIDTSLVENVSSSFEDVENSSIEDVENSSVEDVGNTSIEDVKNKSIEEVQYSLVDEQSSSTEELQSSTLSQAKFEALEAKLMEEMAKIDDSYGSFDEDDDSFEIETVTVKSPNSEGDSDEVNIIETLSWKNKKDKKGNSKKEKVTSGEKQKVVLPKKEKKSCKNNNPNKEIAFSVEKEEVTHHHNTRRKTSLIYKNDKSENTEIFNCDNAKDKETETKLIIETTESQLSINMSIEEEHEDNTEIIEKDTTSMEIEKEYSVENENKNTCHSKTEVVTANNEEILPADFESSTQNKDLSCNMKKEEITSSVVKSIETKEMLFKDETLLLDDEAEFLSQNKDVTCNIESIESENVHLSTKNKILSLEEPILMSQNEIMCCNIEENDATETMSRRKSTRNNRVSLSKDDNVLLSPTIDTNNEAVSLNRNVALENESVSLSQNEDISCQIEKGDEISITSRKSRRKKSVSISKVEDNLLTPLKMEKDEQCNIVKENESVQKGSGRNTRNKSLYSDNKDTSTSQNKDVPFLKNIEDGQCNIQSISRTRNKSFSSDIETNLLQTEDEMPLSFIKKDNNETKTFKRKSLRNKSLSHSADEENLLSPPNIKENSKREAGFSRKSQNNNKILDEFLEIQILPAKRLRNTRNSTSKIEKDIELISSDRLDNKTETAEIESAESSFKITEETTLLEMVVTKENIDIKTPDDSCRYLEMPSKKHERSLTFLLSYIEKLRNEIKILIPDEEVLVNNIPSAVSMINNGRKRKLDDNVDMCNNKKTKYELTVVVKRGSKSTKVNSKDTPTEITTANSFSLPLSPAESDQSSDKKEDSPDTKISKRKRSSLSKVNNQRYSSDDLYKPRTVFSSRRSRARNTENL